MAVREFDGTDDEIQWAIDALSGMTFGTFAALYKPVSGPTGFMHLTALHTSGGTWRCASGYHGTDDKAGVHNNTAFSSSPSSSLDDDRWHVVVYRKATGSATGRYSIYDYTAAVWGHADGSAAIGDWTSPGVGGTVRMSFQSSSEFFQGRVAVVGVWSNEVHWTADASGDSAIEAAGLEDTLQSWINEAPDALWAFNQASTATAVDDLIGNSDQSSIVGTTVITDDDPPGFSFATSGLPAYSRPILAGRINPDGKVYLFRRFDDALTTVDATASPEVIALSFAIPQVAVSVEAAPAAVSLAFTVLQVTAGVGAGPASVALSFTVPQVTVSVGAVPATITLAFTIPQATASESTIVTPATIALAFSIPQVTVSVAASPATIVLAFSIPQVAVTAGGAPAAIALAFTVPQVTIGVGATPATIALAFAIPQVTAGEGGSVTATPAVIALAFAIPSVSVLAEFLVDKPWKLLGGGSPIRRPQKYGTRHPGWN